MPHILCAALYLKRSRKMNKLIRNSLSIVMVFVLLVCGSVASLGASAALKIDSIKAQAGQEVTMPVYIENNSGFSGTKITVSYDENLKVISVEKGNVLNYGNFVQNADNSADNSFDVVWNSSIENKANGVMFTVTFKLPDNAAGDYNVKITYDKDNTFNAKYDDVTFDCGSAVISVPQNGNSDTDNNVTFWNRIVNFFKKIFDFIRNLFK
ncbi:MAG: hypothetical protein EGR81_11130 [Ruminococcaceae bacterium]|nr:hypothetical protein [Oscillospiraceae bacterium]